VTLVLVVGPSGAGKDSLIRGAREFFAPAGEINFVRRYITRPPDGGEDNYYLDETAFIQLEKSRFYAATWQAHGNRYGIARHALENVAAAVSLCSISRGAIAEFEMAYRDVVTIMVTTQPAILRQRLLRRGRESCAEIERRLTRAAAPLRPRQLIEFDNSADYRSSLANFTRLLAQIGRRGYQRERARFR
jgi:ribose 1,5-bisphosphokinase